MSQYFESKATRTIHHTQHSLTVHLILTEITRSFLDVLVIVCLCTETSKSVIIVLFIKCVICLLKRISKDMRHQTAFLNWWVVTQMRPTTGEK